MQDVGTDPSGAPTKVVARQVPTAHVLTREIIIWTSRIKGALGSSPFRSDPEARWQPGARTPELLLVQARQAFDDSVR